jgi:hypothetical protein
MDARTLATIQLGIVKGLYPMVLQGISAEDLSSKPGGTVSTIAQTYAHVVLSADWLLNEVAQGKELRWVREGWAAKTGGPKDQSDWGPLAAFDLAKFNQFADVILADVEEWYRSAPDAALMKMVDSPMGGQAPAMALVGGLLNLHLAEHMGDIATIKGIRGATGMPF